VNAVELRSLPLPPLTLVKQIGREILTTDKVNSPADIDATVFSMLRQSGYLPWTTSLIKADQQKVVPFY